MCLAWWHNILDAQPWAHCRHFWVVPHLHSRPTAALLGGCCVVPTAVGVWRFLVPGIWSLAALGGDQAVLVTPKRDPGPLRPWSGTRTGLPVPAQVVLAWQSLPPPLPVLLSLPHLCSRPHPSIPLSLTPSLPLPCPFTPSFSLSLLCPFLLLTLGPAPCPCLALARLSLPSLLPCPSADPTTFPRTARVQIWDLLLQTEPAQGAGRGPAPDQRQLCTGQGTARSRLSCPTAGLLQPAPHT